ncbi:MAG: hypothetical protein LBS11_09305 [Oscillospiraceae bacterium]|jgi:hypothetical protein|nr:hypothetical protein [Oscillospiraceae bacterium]
MLVPDTDGVGYYQERGKPVRRIVKGAVVEIPPNVEHWHGAAPDRDSTHIGVSLNVNKDVMWLGEVADEEYNEAMGGEKVKLNWKIEAVALAALLAAFSGTAVYVAAAVLANTTTHMVYANGNYDGVEGYIIDGNAMGEQSQPTDSPLILSDMVVKMTSQRRTAAFRFYDIRAAKEFYGQLPLRLDLSNFRDAQWMFYPPEKLGVADGEAYHDGKKGEFGYYALWGNVFILYNDFYTGGEMVGMSGAAQIEKSEVNQTEAKEARKLVITVGDTRFTATMADNSSAEALMELLSEKPLTIKMSDYGSFEKVGSLGQNLPTNDEQINTTAGDLILYQGNQFVIYYSSNSWTLTRLGRIDNATVADLEKVLGSGDVVVTLSMD